MHHAFIGTEHILLGLLRDPEGVGGEALTNLGVSYDAVREKVVDAIGPNSSKPDGSPPFTPRAKKVLELALREALRLGHSDIGTEHILLGIVREGEGVGATVLVSLGADPARVRHEVIRLMTELSGETRTERPAVVSAAAESTATIEPCCPHCRANVADDARFRTIAVPNDTGDEPVTLDVVYCGRCGSTLHIFWTD
jgi:ATP-dependent Clp protease ATP-binding subunit ClpC